MKINSKNVILFDTTDTVEEFTAGVNNGSNLDWQPLISVSNKSRTNKLYNIVRYFKYFWFPFRVFLKRKKIENLIGWQAFYGFVFAFYCAVFHVKKYPTVTIKNFTFKPKKGLAGKLYMWFINKTIKSKYISKLIVTSPEYAKFCADSLNVSIDKFEAIKFAVVDYTKNEIDEYDEKDYILSIGRSNRDWQFLVDSYTGTNYNIKIICDSFEKTIKLPDNIKLYDNVSPDESIKYINNAKFVFIPILDGRIASGETVLATAMCLSKPVILTKPSTLAEFYVDDEINGYAIDKSKEQLIEKTEILLNDNELYERFSKNARVKYETSLSLHNYGIQVGKLIINLK